MPTLDEAGYPGLRGVSWNGMFAPAKTPKDIVDRIGAEFVRAVNDPKFAAGLEKYGAAPAGMASVEFAAFLKQDMALWAEAVKLAGVKLK